jgi:hypothetical protein
MSLRCVSASTFSRHSCRIKFRWTPNLLRSWNGLISRLASALSSFLVSHGGLQPNSCLSFVSAYEPSLDQAGHAAGPYSQRVNVNPIRSSPHRGWFILIVGYTEIRGYIREKFARFFGSPQSNRDCGCCFCKRPWHDGYKPPGARLYR